MEGRPTKKHLELLDSPRRLRRLRNCARRVFSFPARLRRRVRLLGGEGQRDAESHSGATSP